MRLGAENAGTSGVTLDAINLADQVEGLLRFEVLALLENPATSVCEAPGTDAPSWLCHRAVASELVDDEPAG
jgi:hypothetical protein